MNPERIFYGSAACYFDADRSVGYYFGWFVNQFWQREALVCTLTAINTFFMKRFSTSPFEIFISGHDPCRLKSID
jgi:hypothetical protein